MTELEHIILRDQIDIATGIIVIPDKDTKFALPIICPKTKEIISAETLYNRCCADLGYVVRDHIADLVFDNLDYTNTATVCMLEVNDAVSAWAKDVRIQLGIIPVSADDIHKANDLITRHEAKLGYTLNVDHRKSVLMYQFSSWTMAYINAVYDAIHTSLTEHVLTQAVFVDVIANPIAYRLLTDQGAAVLVYAGSCYELYMSESHDICIDEHGMDIGLNSHNLESDY